MMDTSSLCFTQLLGQEKAKRLLRRSLAAGRIPHAYIFKGPEGVGKKMFARGVAAALNCRDVNVVGACGLCSSCKKFRTLNHPDFMVVRPEKGVIKIDQIRRLTRELSYPPYESALRVVVIEDVQAMRREAANSLLKTLEEPPENNLLILTAEASQEILPTLTSRCQVIPFSQLSIDDTTTILVSRGMDRETAVLLARLAEGSPGRALLFQKTDMIVLWRKIVAFLSDPAIDADRDVGLLLSHAENMAALKDELPALLGLLKIWVRDLLMGEERQNAVVPLLKKWNASELLARLQALDRAGRELARNCNRNLICEVLLFKLQ
ncbi:DNA polymerase III subunit delta' [Desulfopila sp. IMCC35006]|uniref:DNA polymerase III subunit delta' n=1 Tax=Desulfopila sp. IMCC35006 TaxID=2569542 RepID=UPI0010AD0017|nr:DNA polymerase III subunit delta' [Desulfopila sp. IMCC35006]TKB24864.1 DNA polymerase III subunit delta' [Desulfopila sp. IMCC35006]